MTPIATAQKMSDMALFTFTEWKRKRRLGDMAIRSYQWISGRKSTVARALSDKLTAHKGLALSEWDLAFVRYHSIDTGVVKKEDK